MLSNSKKSISFMRSLCVGKIEQDVIFPFPKMKEEEKVILKDVFSSIESWLKPLVNEFRKWDVQGHMPEEIVTQIKELGLFGLIIPEEFGGLGLSTTGYSRVLQELARYDASVALTVGAHSSIGMRGLLLFGTPQQKEKYLPALASGKRIAAFCLTEAQAGSDAASLKTKATLTENGDYILNGEKIWITNGSIANFLTVFARTDGPEGQITAFIVPTDECPGVTFGPHEDKMGIRGSFTTTVHFDQVRVPKENILGSVGKGFKVAMKILNSGRTGLGGGCIGAMKHLIQLATVQASNRQQFGQSIAKFGLIKDKIGNMVVNCYVTESVVNLVAGLIDQGYEEYAVEAAISKVFASESLWKCADQALQIAGGNGFMREFPYERIMRDCRINRIFEGTNEVLRLFIAMTAMHDAGKMLKDFADSWHEIFEHPLKGFGYVSGYAKKVVFQVTGVSNEKSHLKNIHHVLASAVNIFDHSVRSLTTTVDIVLRRHGKKIVEKQFALARLANVMIEVFALAAVISRVNSSIEEKGLLAAEREISIANIFAKRTDKTIANLLRQIETNEDELIKSLSDYMVEQQHFVWDVL